MRIPIGLLIVSVAAIFALWRWMGAPVDLPPSLAAATKIACLSYAPFRGAQSPLGPGTRIELKQIEDDLSRLAAVTSCVRTYSIQHGLDQAPEVAERFGLKVIQGLWLSSDRALNRAEIDGVIALAKRYPQVIASVVVGNEVLLRGELSAGDLAQVIREVKAAVPMPVTYADVWEYWLRNRDLASAADFITIHILPYWEDDPVSARRAGDHLDAIRARVAAAFPGREILIGEVGWPSQGRMRESALPSPSNQARVIAETLVRAARQGYRVNLIEAFDQPWKRALEGTVGGYWGLYTAEGRTPKFVFGQPVSDHPYWRLQALGGVVLACSAFAAAWLAAGRVDHKLPARVWIAVAANAVVAGALAGWAIEKSLIESLGVGGAARGAALGLLAVAPALVGSALLARGETLPGFARVLGARDERPADPLALFAGALLILLALIAAETALGLVFDPRYRDFPFAALTAATVPFLALRVVIRARLGSAACPLPNSSPRAGEGAERSDAGGGIANERSDQSRAGIGPQERGARGAAETAFACVLAASALFIALNEGVANWQAVWLVAALLGVALTLALARDGRSS